jgi:peptidoglycan hydrolase CwlO-like protein
VVDQQSLTIKIKTMNLGKKILSAFVEVTETKDAVAMQPNIDQATISITNNLPSSDKGKFREYFEKLFMEANIPGPDYYEFSKMIEVMQAIPDEKARYAAAFAGLRVQGLDKEKLLSTANEYLRLLDADAVNFNATIDVTLEQKVKAKRNEVDEKNRRIQQLSEEISNLQAAIVTLTQEISESEEKLRVSTSGYSSALEDTKNGIRVNIEKIKTHIS